MKDGIKLFIFFRHKIKDTRVTLEITKNNLHSNINISKLAFVDMIANSIDEIEIKEIDIKNKFITFSMKNNLWTFRLEKSLDKLEI